MDYTFFLVVLTLIISIVFSINKDYGSSACKIAFMTAIPEMGDKNFSIGNMTTNYSSVFFSGVLFLCAFDAKTLGIEKAMKDAYKLFIISLILAVFRIILIENGEGTQQKIATVSFIVFWLSNIITLSLTTKTNMFVSLFAGQLFYSLFFHTLAFSNKTQEFTSIFNAVLDSFIIKIAISLLFIFVFYVVKRMKQKTETIKV